MKLLTLWEVNLNLLKEELGVNHGVSCAPGTQQMFYTIKQSLNNVLAYS
jgi:hypothetical protein